MSHFTQLNQEVHSYHVAEIPESLRSNTNPQAMRTRNRIYQVSSTSQSQNSGGVILFNLPPANYSISKGTVQLRCRVTVNGANMGASSGNNVVGFQGPGNTATAVPAVANNTGLNAALVPSLGNGYSWMQRITVYGASSAIVEQRNFLNDDMNLLLLHNSNPTYLATDGQIALGLGASFNYAAGWNTNTSTSCYVDLCLPVPLSLFNSSTQDCPIYLLSSPLTIQIDCASVARAIFKGSSATVTDYTISNTFLVFQAVELQSDHIQAERAASKSSPFVMNLTSTLSVQVPYNLLSSYSLGLNCSSLRGVFVLPANAASYASGTQLQYQRYNSDGAGAGGLITAATNFASSGQGVNNILFLDGNQVNSAIYDTPQMVFQGLKQALHHSLQASVLYPSPCNLLGYMLNHYAIGWDCSSFDEESVIFPGLPVTTVNLQLSGQYLGDASSIGGPAAASNAICTVICVYDVLLAFTEGNMEVKR